MKLEDFNVVNTRRSEIVRLNNELLLLILGVVNMWRPDDSVRRVSDRVSLFNFKKQANFRSGIFNSYFYLSVSIR